MQSHNNPFIGILIVPLTQGYSTIIDAIDIELIDRSYRILKRANGEPAYAITGYGNKTHSLHRQILERMQGRPLNRKEHTDHKNNNGFDNRRSNLRFAAWTSNSQNMKKKSDSKQPYKGIQQLPSGRWSARITINKKTEHIGTFDTPEEAHEAYCQKAHEAFGEFARFE